MHKQRHTRHHTTLNKLDAATHFLNPLSFRRHDVRTRQNERKAISQRAQLKPSQYVTGRHTLKQLRNIFVGKTLDVRCHMQRDDRIVTRPSKAIPFEGLRAITMSEIFPAPSSCGKRLQNFIDESLALTTCLLEHEVINARDSTQTVITILHGIHTKSQQRLHATSRLKNFVAPDVKIRAGCLLAVDGRPTLIA